MALQEWQHLRRRGARAGVAARLGLADPGQGPEHLEGNGGVAGIGLLREGTQHGEVGSTGRLDAHEATEGSMHKGDTAKPVAGGERGVCNDGERLRH